MSPYQTYHLISNQLLKGRGPGNWLETDLKSGVTKRILAAELPGIRKPRLKAQSRLYVEKTKLD